MTTVQIKENGDIEITGINSLTINSVGGVTIQPVTSKYPKRPLNPVVSGLLTQTQLEVFQKNHESLSTLVATWEYVQTKFSAQNSKVFLGTEKYSQEYSLSCNPGRQTGKSYFILSNMKVGDIMIVNKGNMRRVFETEVRYPVTEGIILTANEVLMSQGKINLPKINNIYVDDASHIAPELITKFYEIFKKPIILIG